MWKAVTCLVIGILVGAFISDPAWAKKKGRPPENQKLYARIRIDEDLVARWKHICCDCSLSHDVEMQVVEYLGPDGQKRYGIQMMWVVDSELTKKNRIEKWGPFWDRSDQFKFSAEHGGPSGPN